MVVGTTEKLWELQIPQSPSSNHAGFLNSLFFLNKDSTDTPLLATNIHSHQKTLALHSQSQQDTRKSPVAMGPSPEFLLSPNTKRAPHEA